MGPTRRPKPYAYQQFSEFQMVKCEAEKSPARTVILPGGGRTVEESDMANSSPPGGGA